MSTIAPTFASLWANYRCPPMVYDEVLTETGELRPHWSGFVQELLDFPPDEFARRTAQAEEMLDDNGVTFDVFRELDVPQRPWRLDLIPLMLPSSEWQTLEAAINQRARLLDAVVRDIYGPKKLVAEKLLPPEVLFAHPRFYRPFCDLNRPDRPSVILYAAEIARGLDGNWCVMADRTEAPVGTGYALENRIVTSRTVPTLMHRQPVHRLAPFFIRLQNSLKELTVRKSENPRIVLLSPGPHRPYYFEDVYLSGYLGYTLAQGADLAVRDDRVYLKTLAGLMPVDVILSRGFERGIDPLEMGGNSPHGVPGLLQAIRKGTVALANRPGCGIVESPIFMSFLPQLCRRLLTEELLLPSIPTWWCGNASERQYVLDHLRDLVIKPAFEASGGEEIIGHRLSQDELAELRGRILARPYAFLAQETIARSATPSFSSDQHLSAGHVAARLFGVANGDKYEVMPGGLVRVAPSPEPMELSVSAGIGSKDLWVLAEGPVVPVTLLTAAELPVTLRRSGALFPSRVADDLFWLGWSIERVDFLARLLRSLLERLTAETNTIFPELPTIIRALADQGQLEPGFAVDELSPQLPPLDEVLSQVLFDTNEIRGLGHAVAEMLRLGALVRDRISPDTWHKLQDTGTEFLDPHDRSDQDLAELLVRLNAVILNLASVSGLIEDGMIRGPAWLFVDLGRRIERGNNTASLLLTALSSDEVRERTVVRAILEVLDCRMTYRSRYLDNFQANGLLDLFITDETNPRSVAYQAVAIAEHVDSLPQDVSSPLRTEEKRLAMAIVHSVRMITPDELASADLAEIEQLLQRVVQQFKSLGDTITRKYLVHSGTTRQFTGEGELSA